MTAQTHMTKSYPNVRNNLHQAWLGFMLILSVVDAIRSKMIYVSFQGHSENVT